MFCSIDSIHLNYDPISGTQGIQSFSSISNTQECIILDQLNQIYIVDITGKRGFLALQHSVIQVNIPLVSNFKL